MTDDEFAFAEPLRPTRPGPLERAYRRFSTGRFRRRRERLFFGVPGLPIVAGAFALNVRGWLNDPLALMLGLVGLCVFGFGLLPPHQPRPASRS